MEGAKAATLWHWMLNLSQFYRLVAVDPKEPRAGPDPYAFPWVLVICAAVLGLLALPFFLWLRAIREKICATMLCELLEEKCQLLEKVSLAQKELKGLQSYLKEASCEPLSAEVESLKATCGELERSKSQLTDEILLLEKELQEQKAQCSQQHQLRAELSKTEQFLQEGLDSLTSQLAEARESHLTLQSRTAELQDCIAETLKENSQLQKSQKQLLQEARAQKKQVRELRKQKVTLQHQLARANEELYDKEGHMRTLTSRLVKMTDWAAVLGEDLVVEGDLELGLQATESAAPGERQPAGPLATLVTAARLRARLQSLEEERSQIRTRLLEEDKITDDLRERIRTLEAERAAMDLEKRHFQSVKEKLQQKADVMKEVYLQNGRKLIWQIILEERQRLDKEEELGQTLGKISHADEELKTCKKQLRHLEKQLEAASLHHQQQMKEYDRNEQQFSIFAESCERRIENLLEQNKQRKRQLIELFNKYDRAPEVPHTAHGGEDFPRHLPPLGQAPSTSSRRHAWSLSRLFSIKRLPWRSRPSIPSGKPAFTKRCFSLFRAPKSGSLPPPPRPQRSSTCK